MLHYVRISSFGLRSSGIVPTQLPDLGAPPSQPRDLLVGERGALPALAGRRQGPLRFRVRLRRPHRGLQFGKVMRQGLRGMEVVDVLWRSDLRSPSVDRPT